eukprot:scaffold827_cov369-Prasinococcus_capsulatus_cf.AAC.23
MPERSGRLPVRRLVRSPAARRCLQACPQSRSTCRRDPARPAEADSIGISASPRRHIGLGSSVGIPGNEDRTESWPEAAAAEAAAMAEEAAAMAEEAAAMAAEAAAMAATVEQEWVLGLRPCRRHISSHGMHGLTAGRHRPFRVGPGRTCEEKDAATFKLRRLGRAVHTEGDVEAGDPCGVGQAHDIHLVVFGDVCHIGGVLVVVVQVGALERDETVHALGDLNGCGITQKVIAQNRVLLYDHNLLHIVLGQFHVHVLLVDIHLRPLPCHARAVAAERLVPRPPGPAS